MNDSGPARCQLVYRAFDGDGRSGRPILALHDEGGSASDVEPLAAATARPVYAPQAARPANPFQSDLPSVAAYRGFRWYLADAPERPEAASFADSLEQVAAFAGEHWAGQAAATVVGVGQGGALAAAALWCGIAAVAAAVCVDGYLPEWLAGEAPRRTAATVVLVSSDARTMAWRDATAQAFRDAGADVRTSVWPGGYGAAFARPELAAAAFETPPAASKSNGAEDSMTR